MVAVAKAALAAVAEAAVVRAVSVVVAVAAVAVAKVVSVAVAEAAVAVAVAKAASAAVVVVAEVVVAGTDRSATVWKRLKAGETRGSAGLPPPASFSPFRSCFSSEESSASFCSIEEERF